MKLCLSLISLFILTAGCASHKLAPNYVKTVSSDLYPAEMSRDQYYEEMARAYSNDQQIQKAIDEYRLALLHNPLRISARLGLSDEYKKLEYIHLAAFELSEVLKIQPNNSEALLRQGELYLAAQIYAKAKTAFGEALKANDQLDKAKWALFYISKLEKNQTEAETYLGQIKPTENNQVKILLEKALLAKHFERKDEYSKLIKQAYAFQPHDKKVVLEMKNDDLRVGDYDSALMILNHYTDSHDFDLEISEGLAEVAVQSENYELALRELDKQRSWVKDPETIDIKKANVYFLAGRLPEAEKIYSDVLAQNPAQDEAQFYLAQIYLAQNDLAAAKPLLSDLPAGSSYFADAQVRLAQSEVQNDQDEAAVNRLDRAQAQRPDQLVLYKAYADLLVDMHKYSHAIQVLEIGSEFFPHDEDLQIKSAVVYYHLGDQASFKKSLDRALQLNPENAEIYASLAELWFLKKISAKDVEAFALKAIEYKSKNKNVKPLLAWALMAQDRSTASISLFEKFYEENPKQPFFAEALSKVYRTADATIKAQQMSAQALKLQDQQNIKSGLRLDSNRRPASEPGH